MPSNVNASSSRLAPSMIGTSCRISWMLTTSGAIRALMPRMNSTLKMLLPTTLPMAMSVLPSSTAPTLTATSGALVPKATMVSPTTSGLMPNDRASLDAPRTSTLAPMTSRIRPPRNMSMFMIGHCSCKHLPTAGRPGCGAHRRRRPRPTSWPEPRRRARTPGERHSRFECWAWGASPKGDVPRRPARRDSCRSHPPRRRSVQPKPRLAFRFIRCWRSRKAAFSEPPRAPNSRCPSTDGDP